MFSGHLCHLVGSGAVLVEAVVAVPICRLAPTGFVPRFTACDWETRPVHRAHCPRVRLNLWRVDISWITFSSQRLVLLAQLNDLCPSPISTACFSFAHLNGMWTLLVPLACSPLLVGGRGPSRRGTRTSFKTVCTSTRSAQALACNKLIYVTHVGLNLIV